MLEIRVTMDEAGRVQIAWPENAPGTSILLLEEAAQRIKKAMAAKEKGGIVAVSGDVLNKLKVG